MARDLETLRDKLWEVFEGAVKVHLDYEDKSYSSSNSPTNLKILNRQAIGQLGQAIAAVETELGRRAEAQAESDLRHKKSLKLG